MLYICREQEKMKMMKNLLYALMALAAMVCIVLSIKYTDAKVRETYGEVMCKVDSLRSEISNLSNKVDTLATNDTYNIEVLNTEMKGIKGKVVSIENEIREINADLDCFD